MFICLDCHDKDCWCLDLEQMIPSYGPCECCGQTKQCMDCHHDCFLHKT